MPPHSATSAKRGSASPPATRRSRRSRLCSTRSHCSPSRSTSRCSSGSSSSRRWRVRPRRKTTPPAKRGTPRSCSAASSSRTPRRRCSRVPWRRWRRVDDTVLSIDFHAHTKYSHDGRPGWTEDDVRDWHRAAGYDVAYITDHRDVRGRRARHRGESRAGGQGTMTLQGLEAFSAAST